MIRTKFVILSVIVMMLASSYRVYSWTEATHSYLSKTAAEKSIIGTAENLKNIGFERGLDQPIELDGEIKKIVAWFEAGAEFEDMSDPFFPIIGTTRSVNHFHNPLKPWSQAGLDDWILLSHYTGESSLLWAQNGSNQSNYPKGDWSWQTIRNYYYLALTSTSDSERQTNFAKLFKGLGHQMHLIQDAAQPDHVRNDAHPEDTFSGVISPIGFEKWAKREFSLINSFASNAELFIPTVDLNISYNNLAPITQFIDAEVYSGTNPSSNLTQGISEYTNANFFSDDTIFAAERYQSDDRHYFPYPKISSTDLQSYIIQNKLPETVIGEDNIPDTAVWIRKTGDGEVIDHFVRPSYLTDNVFSLFGDDILYRRTFYRDEKCHEDYAQKLIPRAVGYSSALIDYFFRGDIDLVADEVTGSGYLIVNNAEEDMDGTFEIYYDNIDDERIPLWSGSFGLGSLGSENNESLNINFTAPVDAKLSGRYILIFWGRMGSEEDAVIGKIVEKHNLAIFFADGGTIKRCLTTYKDIMAENTCNSEVANSIFNSPTITDNYYTRITQKAFRHNGKKIYLVHFGSTGTSLYDPVKEEFYTLDDSREFFNASDQYIYIAEAYGSRYINLFTYDGVGLTQVGSYPSTPSSAYMLISANVSPAGDTYIIDSQTTQYGSDCSSSYHNCTKYRRLYKYNIFSGAVTEVGYYFYEFKSTTYTPHTYVDYHYSYSDMTMKSSQSSIYIEFKPYLYSYTVENIQGANGTSRYETDIFDHTINGDIYHSILNYSYSLPDNFTCQWTGDRILPNYVSMEMVSLINSQRGLLIPHNSDIPYMKYERSMNDGNIHYYHSGDGEPCWYPDESIDTFKTPYEVFESNTESLSYTSTFLAEDLVGRDFSISGFVMRHGIYDSPDYYLELVLYNQNGERIDQKLMNVIGITDPASLRGIFLVE